MTAGFLKKVGQSTIVRVVSIGLSFALSVLLARSLGAAGYGAYSFAFAVISLVVLIGQIGFPNLTVREIGRYLERRRPGLITAYLRHSYRVMLVVGFALVAMLAIPLLFMTDDGSKLALLAGLPMVVLFPLIGQSSSVLQAVGRVVESLYAQQLFRPGLLFLLAGSALLLGYPLTAVTVMGLHVVASLAVFLQVRFRATRVLETPPASRVSKARRMQWTAAAFMFTGIAVARLINTKFDLIAIGFLLGDAQAGVYAVAAQLSIFAMVMLQITSGVTMPAMARAAQANNDRQIENLLRSSAQLSVVSASAALIVVYFLGEWGLELIYGPEFVAAWTALLILVCGQVINGFFGPIGMMLNIRGFERFTLVATGLAAITNIALNFALIPSFGLPGAAFATVASLILWNIVLWYRTWANWRINSSALPWPGRADSTPNLGAQDE